MWTRKELKDKAKVSFRANYWKSVLVALIVLAITAGVGPASSSVAGSAPSPSSEISSVNSPDNVDVEIKDGRIKIDVDDKGGKVHVDVDDDLGDLADVIHDATEGSRSPHVGFWMGPGMVLVGLSALLIVLIALAVALAVYVFVLSPLEAGAARFFVRNLNQRAEVREVAYGYDNNYREVVKTLFLRSLFVFLWGLLLIIPGIYKAYEYRMIPYLLAEDPSMTKDRAFSESKRMMDGQKWNAFVLDLSFLGWNILSAFTLGILGVFYVGPYQTQTNAALYVKLRYGLPETPSAQTVPGQPIPPSPAGTAPAGTAPMGTPSAAAAPVATAAGETAPVIVSASQPPVVPFAAVGAQPLSAPDEVAANAKADEPTAPLEETTAIEPSGSSDAASGETGKSEGEVADSPNA